MVLDNERIFITKLLERKKYWSLSDIYINYVMTYPFDFPFSTFVLSNITTTKNKTISDVLKDKDLIYQSLGNIIYTRYSSVDGQFKAFYHSPYNSLMKYLFAMKAIIYYYNDQNKDNITFYPDGNGEYWILYRRNRKVLIFNSGSTDRRIVVVPEDQWSTVDRWNTLDEALSSIHYYYSMVFFGAEICPSEKCYYDLMFDWLLSSDKVDGKKVDVIEILDESSIYQYKVINNSQEKVSKLYDALDSEEAKQLDEIMS